VFLNNIYVGLIVLVSSKKLENIDFCSQQSFIWQYLWCLKCTTNFVVAVFVSSLNCSHASGHICVVLEATFRKPAVSPLICQLWWWGRTGGL